MFKAEVYSNRRKRLSEKVKNGIILILGNVETPMNYPSNTYHFRQDSNFLYFFGINCAGMAGIIDVETGKEYIFGNDFDIDDIIWMGPQPTTKELALKSGIYETLPFSKLGDFIYSSQAGGKTIHFLPPYRAENKILLSELLNTPVAYLKQKASIELIKSVVSLRSIKDEFEIEELEKVQETAYMMHTTAMKFTRPGIYESEIAGIVEGIALGNRGNVSFPVICSIHGETLHNHYHGNIMKDGDLLIIDAGAESELNYCSDHTRTIPVSGKFSQKQKEIYEIVLKANVECTKAIKPGIKYQEIHLLSAKIIAEGLKSVGLMKGDADAAVKNGAHALFYPHGLGHMMGLDVHDMEDLGENYVGYDDETSRIDQFGTAYLRLGRRLEPGFVMTVEPGIYFIPALIDLWKSENKFQEFINYDKLEEYRSFGGIRIEDDILVTKDGYKLLGKPIPKTVEEIEEFMKK